MKSWLWLVNLIPCNKNAGFEPPHSAQTAKFIKTLKGLGVNAVQRYRFGDDIKGACGQLGGAQRD